MNQLWKAPETFDTLVIKKTPDIDVYSFGIIIQEVVLRSLPYAMYPEIPLDGDLKKWEGAVTIKLYIRNLIKTKNAIESRQTSKTEHIWL